MSDGDNTTTGFSLRSTHRDEAVVLAVAGEIDIATGTRLRSALSEVLEEPGARVVVLDLTDVSYMASTGIAVLMDARWSAEQRAKSLRVVVGAAPVVGRLLRTTGADKALIIYPDVAAALA